MSVVKYVSSPPAEKIDWRRTATFYIFTKIGDKSCKVILDSESCINAISSRLCENLGLEIISHLHLFKVFWIDSIALEVKQQCLVPVSFNHYKDKIWCDVITMNMGQVILGRAWLFDKNVTIYGQSNMCQFEHKGKQIKLLSLRLKTEQPCQLHPLHFSLLLFLVYLSLIMYTISANHFLPYYRHHLTIKHSSLYLHLHHINTCTNYTEISDGN